MVLLLLLSLSRKKVEHTYYKMDCRDMFPTYLGVNRVFPLFEIILFLRRASLKKNYTLFQIIIKISSMAMGEWVIRPINKGDCESQLYHSNPYVL